MSRKSSNAGDGLHPHGATVAPLFRTMSDESAVMDRKHQGVKELFVSAVERNVDEHTIVIGAHLILRRSTKSFAAGGFCSGDSLGVRLIPRAAASKMAQIALDERAADG